MSREKRSRRQFTREQTGAILRRHLVDKNLIRLSLTRRPRLALPSSRHPWPVPTRLPEPITRPATAP